MRKFSVHVVWILGVFAAAVAAEDSVEYTDADGKRQVANGTIREETPKLVSIQTSRGATQVPVNAIRSIRYDKRPPELSRAQSEMRQSRWENALEFLDQSLKQVPERETNLRAAIGYDVVVCRAGMAQQDPAQVDKAIAAIEEFRSQNSSSRHHYPLHELLGNVYLAKGDFDNAAKSFAVLKETDWPGYKERAGVYQGLADLRQGNAKVALRSLDRVIADAGTDAESQQQKKIAQVYKAEALVQDGQSEKAVELLEQILPTVAAEETQIKAVAHNALGDALRQANQPKKAILDGYLWVYVVYNKDPRELSRALYNLAELFAQVGDQQKADRMAAELKSGFPTSEWVKKLDTKDG